MAEFKIRAGEWPMEFTSETDNRAGRDQDKICRTTKEGHEGAVERESVDPEYLKEASARFAADMKLTGELMDSSFADREWNDTYGFVAATPQWRKCLRGEREAVEGLRRQSNERESLDGGTTWFAVEPTQVCRHCRSVFVPR